MYREAPPPESGARIVVADDQPDVRVALGLLLKAEGHRVEAVGSPAALLEAVGRGADLVLMDLNYTRDTTSGAEGLDLLERLRERSPGTPVVVMTAWGSIELAVEAMRRGARSFVLKPWENSALQRLVEAELQEASRSRKGSSGKGPAAGSARDLAVASRVQAELLTAHLQALLRSQAPRALDDLAGFLSDVNAQFHASTAPEHYATLFFGLYDDFSRVLRYANCGHNPPLGLRADGRQVRLEPTAPLVGLLPEWTVRVAETRLLPGDLLLFFSDGITEAGRGRGEEFGERRLIETLRARRRLAVGDLLPALVDAVEAFAGEAHEDDLTLVGLRGI